MILGFPKCPIFEFHKTNVQLYVCNYPKDKSCKNLYKHVGGLFRRRRQGNETPNELPGHSGHP